MLSLLRSEGQSSLGSPHEVRQEDAKSTAPECRKRLRISNSSSTSIPTGGLCLHEDLARQCDWLLCLAVPGLGVQLPKVAGPLSQQARSYKMDYTHAYTQKKAA